MPESLDRHCKRVAKAIAELRVVPFLGAGANLCGRPPGTVWKANQKKYLPKGDELADYLADEFFYPDDKARDLARVSQYAAVMDGEAPLFNKLRPIFKADHPSTSLHQLLARLPAKLRDKGYYRHEDSEADRGPVFVSTNYDDLLERAFQEEKATYHLVTYEAVGEDKGKFFHRPPGASRRTLIEKPNEYRGLLDRDPIIVKIHGSVDRESTAADSFVITEDHYIDYLAHTETSRLLPAPLPAILNTTGLLFLGYSLQDWNLRVMLHRIWKAQRLGYASWAIQLDADDLDRKCWAIKNVEIVEHDLQEYIKCLGRHLDALPDKGGSV